MVFTQTPLLVSIEFRWETSFRFCHLLAPHIFAPEDPQFRRKLASKGACVYSIRSIARICFFEKAYEASLEWVKHGCNKHNFSLISLLLMVVNQQNDLPYAN